jgi:hypothetical protein
MKRWITALVAAAGGGALIAVSAAQAAAFTPTPSATAAVPASDLRSTAPLQKQLPLKGDQQQQQQQQLVWDLFKVPQVIFVGSGGSPIEQLREAAMLDVSPPKDAKLKVFDDPCQWSNCPLTQKLVVFTRSRTGTTTKGTRAYPGEEALDLDVREGRAR